MTAEALERLADRAGFLWAHFWVRKQLGLAELMRACERVFLA